MSKNMLRFLRPVSLLIREDKCKLALCAHEELKPLGPPGTVHLSSLPAYSTRWKPRNRFFAIYHHTLQEATWSMSLRSVKDILRFRLVVEA